MGAFMAPCSRNLSPSPGSQAPEAALVSATRSCGGRAHVQPEGGTCSVCMFVLLELINVIPALGASAHSSRIDGCCCDAATLRRCTCANGTEGPSRRCCPSTVGPDRSKRPIGHQSASPSTVSFYKDAQKKEVFSVIRDIKD